MMRKLSVALALLMSTSAYAQQRPMTFLDMQQMRQGGSYTPSPNGKLMLYTASTPNWKDAKRQSDIYVVNLEQGVASTRQLTFSKEKNETSPKWAMDGSYFVYMSDRDGAATQLYQMRLDGGEGRQITSGKDTVTSFAFSKDGKWLAYRAGKPNEEQMYLLSTSNLEATPQQLTRSPLVLREWEWSPDSKRIYFTADTADALEKLRREKKFTVNVRNAATAPSQLYAYDLDSKQIITLTRDPAYHVSDVVISDDSRWIGFRGTDADRYMRNITEESINSDLFLLNVATGNVERVTNNKEVSEQNLSFSPDSKWIAFGAPDDLTKYTMTNARVYLRRVDDVNGQLRKLGSGFDGDVSVGFWSADGRTIYFNEGVRATNQVLALDVASGNVRQLTNTNASTSLSRDDDTGVLLVNYADPKTPPTVYTIATATDVANRAKWRQLTDLNPQVRGFALGTEEEITWRSTDGKMVSGVLVKPAGYQAGQRYPLIVAIHGGPASADVLGFNGGYGAEVYAGAGYAVLRPNYRGSTNYGEAHRNGIVGNYFDPGYQDIMTGVDYLIAQGIADSTRMGALGWSAGGHWSNWILTHTNRFKAISTGAGTSNWISMYAQSDVQRNRQYYLGDKLPYDDFEAYWNQSPLKYIKNAKTPTMIHVVEGDPRVPSPQSIELHMALKKLGVPTELYLYPGRTHGIPDPRNQLFKSVAEMAWMDHYVRGRGSVVTWKDVMKAADLAAEESTPAKTGVSQNR